MFTVVNLHELIMLDKRDIAVIAIHVTTGSSAAMRVMTMRVIMQYSSLRLLFIAGLIVGTTIVAVAARREHFSGCALKFRLPEEEKIMKVVFGMQAPHFALSFDRGGYGFFM